MRRCKSFGCSRKERGNLERLILEIECRASRVDVALVRDVESVRHRLQTQRANTFVHSFQTLRFATMFASKDLQRFNLSCGRCQRPYSYSDTEEGRSPTLPQVALLLGKNLLEVVWTDGSSNYFRCASSKLNAKKRCKKHFSHPSRLIKRHIPK